MAIVIAKRIREREFGGEITSEAQEVLRRTSRAALATPITGKGLPPGPRLLKVYATSPGGARRVVYLLAVEDTQLFLLFYRDKNDPVGRNVSPKNPAFATALRQHLALLREDIAAGQFDQFETE